MIKYLLLVLVALLFSIKVLAQENAQAVLKEGIRFNIADKPNYFVKIGAGVQIWARYMELNKGSSDFNGKPVETATDLSLRRTLFSAYAHLDKITMFSMFCMGSQPHTIASSPFANSATQFYFYDAWTSYAFHPKHLSIGMGLNMYNGISRFASASSMRTLGADVPIITAPNLITTEQQARQLGFFATGKFGKFDYRISVSKPFVCNMLPTTPLTNTAYEYPNDNWSVKGYFQMQLLDKETHAMPFYSGTYLGEKRVFNIGIGADFHPNSTIVYYDDGSSYTHHKLHIGADVYLDLPLKKNSAINYYAAAYYFDYGPNYLLTYAALDIYGNSISEPQQGTGMAFITQIGYVLPIAFKNQNKIQAYSTFIYRDYEALSIPNYHIDAGINYYIAGHHAKCTMEWQYRPVWEASSQNYYFKNMVIFKAQVFI